MESLPFSYRNVCRATLVTRLFVIARSALEAILDLTEISSERIAGLFYRQTHVALQRIETCEDLRFSFLRLSV
jgi:hypothetical protein